MTAETPSSSFRATLHAYRRSFELLGPEKGLAAILTGAGMAVAALQVAEPVLFGKAIDALTRAESSLPLVVMWGVASFGSFLAGMLVALHADRLTHRRRLAAMTTYLEHVLALPASFHSKARSGRMMNVMLRGCDALFGLWLATFREQLSNIVSLLVLLPIAFWMNWRLALLLIGLMAVYVGVNALVVSRTSGGQSRVTGHFTDISGHVGDLFGNISVVQSFLAMPREMQAIRSSMDRLLAAQYPVLNWWAAMTMLTRASSSISIVSIFVLGAWLAQDGRSSIGEIVSFVGFATLLIGRLDQLTGFIMNLFMEAPVLVQFFEVLEERPEIVEKPGAAVLGVPSGHVRFEHVGFRYPWGSGGVHDLDFEALPGETVALVGPTGSGKTTTLALLQRAYDPESGRILIDGRDIRDVTLGSLRRAIAVVFQEAGLFSRSIAENIVIGKPDATAEEIEDAAHMAEAYDFIMRKELGFDTPVGERGQGLSGGERQRVAVARALLKNAPILILDEATSALDVATEQRVQAALERLRKGRTTFVIAHRLSTVRSADRIIVLDGGRIVEQGTFEDLVRQGGMFARLVEQGGISTLNTRPPAPEDVGAAPAGP